MCTSQGRLRAFLRIKNEGAGGPRGAGHPGQGVSGEEDEASQRRVAARESEMTPWLVKGRGGGLGQIIKMQL